MNIKNLVLSLLTVLFCCGSCVAKSDEYVLSEDRFAELIKGENIRLIDVRTQEEFSQGHIEGAVNIDYSSPQFIELVINKFDTTQTLAIYCRSGARSSNAASLLSKKGFKVYQLKGGILNWSGTTTK